MALQTCEFWPSSLLPLPLSWDQGKAAAYLDLLDGVTLRGLHSLVEDMEERFLPFLSFPLSMNPYLFEVGNRGSTNKGFTESFSKSDDARMILWYNSRNHTGRWYGHAIMELATKHHLWTPSGIVLNVHISSPFWIRFLHIICCCLSIYRNWSIHSRWAVLRCKHRTWGKKPRAYL